MKLLPTKEIAKQKSLERKFEIDEGAKLAKRVDVLRETAASEQERLGTFRIASLKIVQTEIEDLTNAKTLLIEEITALEEKKRIAGLPLDEEWKQLNARIEDADRMTRYLENRKEELDKYNISVLSREEEIKRLEKLHAELVDMAHTHLMDAEDIKSEALQTAETGRREQQERESLLAKAANEIVAREANIATNERNVADRTKALDAKERELNGREGAINDKYQTLLRATKEANRKKK